MPDKQIVKVKVWGDFACFTRPDLKVERMTYPCMTPSAARGIMDCILWKPEFKWYIRRIIVLNPVRFFSIKRNEINSKQRAEPLIIEEVRAQRNTVALRDTAFIIEASVHLDKPSASNPPVKYVEMFRRRAAKGQCWRRPYLGTREFSAEFAEPSGSEKPLAEDIPIGPMLLDMFYYEDGSIEPKFFEASVKQGVLDCEMEYEQMMDSFHQPGDSMSDYAKASIHALNLAEEAEND